MINPVILVETGCTFEDDRIKQWLETNSVCPVTQQQLVSKQLVPNEVLKSLISEWAIHAVASRGIQTSLTAAHGSASSSFEGGSAQQARSVHASSATKQFTPANVYSNSDVACTADGGLQSGCTAIGIHIENEPKLHARIPSVGRVLDTPSVGRVLEQPKNPRPCRLSRKAGVVVAVVAVVLVCAGGAVAVGVHYGLNSKQHAAPTGGFKTRMHRPLLAVRCLQSHTACLLTNNSLSVPHNNGASVQQHARVHARYHVKKAAHFRLPCKQSALCQKKGASRFQWVQDYPCNC
jgi:hypothetical protein